MNVQLTALSCAAVSACAAAYQMVADPGDTSRAAPAVAGLDCTVLAGDHCAARAPVGNLLCRCPQDISVQAAATASAHGCPASCPKWALEPASLGVCGVNAAARVTRL